MSKYLKLFENHSQYEAFIGGGGMDRPNVSYCKDNNEVHYNPSGWKYEYLTFEVVEGGTITIKATDASVAKTISYKVNDGEWTELTTSTTEQAFGGTLNVGDKVLVRGNNATYGTLRYYNNFSGTAKVNVYGNIMSLISGDDFADSITLSEGFTFMRLFNGYTNLLSAEKLVLPATTLADNCYQNMFQGTSIITAPELPATTLASGCYGGMFYNCTSLTSAPELPATTLATYCYQNMFKGCTSLTKAPELPATTLAIACYQNMFQGCTSLNYIKAMFTTTPSTSYTNYWVYNVASTGTFVKNSAATWDVTGNDGIPTGCTVETATA